MSKKFAGFFVALALCMMLAGCKDDQDIQMDSNQIQESEKTESISESADTIEEISESKRPGILEAKVPLDSVGVISYISNDTVEQTMQQELYQFQNNFLTVFHTYDNETGESFMHMKIICSDTGIVLSETTIPDFTTTWTQVCGEHIVVSDLETGTIRIYNQTLQEYKTYEVEPGAVYLNPGATIAYQFIATGGIKITELETGNSSMILKNSRDLYVSACNGNTVSMSYIDTNTEFLAYAVLHLDTGILEQIPVDASFYGVENANGMWLAGIMDEDNQYLIGDGQNLYRYTPEQTGIMPRLLANPDRILLTNMIDGSTLQMSLYDKNGVFLSSCSIEGIAYIGSEPIWSEGGKGYFLILMDQTGKDRLYFWDFAVEVEGENIAWTPWQDESSIPENTVISEEYYERAANLSEQYGVEIKIAEQCENQVSDYVIKQELDEKYIAAGMDALEKALSSYPEGFLEQLHYSSYRTLEINLCGSIASALAQENKGIGFTIFSAFVNQESGTLRMVLDVRQYSTLEQTIYHEISHLIDRKLAYNAENQKDLLYSEEGWESLNPKDFTYAERLVNLPESVYTDNYDSHFIDIYSRTFATEDRARIMEYAMMGTAGMFERHQGRTEKLEYYCKCIREAFDTTGWPELTKWEETLAAVGGDL